MSDRSENYRKSFLILFILHKTVFKNLIMTSDVIGDDSKFLINKRYFQENFIKAYSLKKISHHFRIIADFVARYNLIFYDDHHSSKILSGIFILVKNLVLIFDFPTSAYLNALIKGSKEIIPFEFLH